jgi:hypothetical protein
MWSGLRASNGLRLAHSSDHAPYLRQAVRQARESQHIIMKAGVFVSCKSNISDRIPRGGGVGMLVPVESWTYLRGPRMSKLSVAIADVERKLKRFYQGKVPYLTRFIVITVLCPPMWSIHTGLGYPTYYEEKIYAKDTDIRISSISPYISQQPRSRLSRHHFILKSQPLLLAHITSSDPLRIIYQTIPRSSTQRIVARRLETMHAGCA